MKRVRKAIIPAAGLGTRFLPATKKLRLSIPKVISMAKNLAEQPSR